MSKVTLERHFIGTMNIPDGKVDITDPGYDADTWCRMTKDIKPGIYNCYAYTGEDTFYSDRVWIAQIVFAEDNDADYAEDKIHTGKSWRSIGGIGVDAGLAGFFSHKPDFNRDEWSDLCDEMFKKRGCNGPISGTYIKTFKTGDGFWTSSGYGDGEYGVYAIRNNRKIVALEIRF